MAFDINYPIESTLTELFGSSRTIKISMQGGMEKTDQNVTESSYKSVKVFYRMSLEQIFLGFTAKGEIENGDEWMLRENLTIFGLAEFSATQQNEVLNPLKMLIVKIFVSGRDRKYLASSDGRNQKFINIRKKIIASCELTPFFQF